MPRMEGSRIYKRVEREDGVYMINSHCSITGCISGSVVGDEQNVCLRNAAKYERIRSR